VGTLIISIGAAYFKNVCEKCHLLSFTNKNVGYYCQIYKCMVFTQSQPRITYKIKSANNEEFDYTLCDPCIKPLLGHKLINFKDFISKQGFFLHLF
jgi:hypothetical protein